jgi:hypothetical protein
VVESTSVVAFYVGLWYLLTRAPYADLHIRGLVFATLTLVAIAVVLQAVLAKATGIGLTGIVLGADSRLSTSKAQYLLWTAGLAFALAYLAFVAGTTGFDCPVTDGLVTNCIAPGSWDSYLILAGAPASSAIVAKGIVGYKLTQGTLQKTDASTTGVGDLVADDNGRLAINDVQYVVFNLITFGYVMTALVRTGVLPAIPDVLLGLTGGSAAAYVLGKALETNQPVVTAVSPRSITPGATVTIRGQNLIFPDTGRSAPLRVEIAGIAASDTKYDNDAITATVPVGIPTSDPALTVITAAGQESAPFPVSVLTPTVLGLQAPLVAGATEIYLLADGLLTSIGKVIVVYGDFSSEATVKSLSDTGPFVVHATLPAPIPPGPEPIPVRIIAGGVSSPPFPIRGSGV